MDYFRRNYSLLPFLIALITFCEVRATILLHFVSTSQLEPSRTGLQISVSLLPFGGDSRCMLMMFFDEGRREVRLLDGYSVEMVMKKS